MGWELWEGLGPFFDYLYIFDGMRWICRIDGSSTRAHTSMTWFTGIYELRK